MRRGVRAAGRAAGILGFGALTLAAVAAVIGIGFVAVVVAIGIGLSNSFDGKPVDAYKPAKSELRATATTVALTAQQCTDLHGLEPLIQRVANHTQLLSDGDGPAAVAAVDALRPKLQAAAAEIGGPVGARLTRADHVAQRLRAQLARFPAAPATTRPSTPPPSFPQTVRDLADDGYTELRIAEVLLGDQCDGHFVPEAMSAMFGPLDGMLGFYSRPSKAERAAVATTTVPSGAQCAPLTASVPFVRDFIATTGVVLDPAKHPTDVIRVVDALTPRLVVAQHSIGGPVGDRFGHAAAGLVALRATLAAAPPDLHGVDLLAIIAKPVGDIVGDLTVADTLLGRQCHGFRVPGQFDTTP